MAKQNKAVNISSEDLKASEERYRNLFENNLAAVFRSEVGGGLVDVNQAVARTYDVAKLPLTLLLDAEGHVRASWSGVPADLAELTPQLERLRQD